MNYKVIDPLIATITGGIVAFAAAQVVPASFNILLGMLAGGLCGMVLQTVFMLPLMAVFGAFEVMIPFGLIAMPVGMLGGMAVAWGGATVFGIIWAGAVIGLFVAILIHYSNRNLVG